MRVGILGSGLMGGKLGTIFARAGHDVVFSYARRKKKLEELARDPRFTSFPDRLEHKAALVQILANRFRERTTAAWLDLLRGHVPCAPVNTVAQALEDEQVRARQMILEVEHPEWGTIREVASPVKTEGAIRDPAPAPALGEHTEAILSEILGYGSQTIARLRAEGVIGK